MLRVGERNAESVGRDATRSWDCGRRGAGRLPGCGGIDGRRVGATGRDRGGGRSVDGVLECGWCRHGLLLLLLLLGVRAVQCADATIVLW